MRCGGLTSRIEVWECVWGLCVLLCEGSCRFALTSRSGSGVWGGWEDGCECGVRYCDVMRSPAEGIDSAAL